MLEEALLHHHHLLLPLLLPLLQHQLLIPSQFRSIYSSNNSIKLPRILPLLLLLLLKVPTKRCLNLVILLFISKLLPLLSPLFLNNNRLSSCFKEMRKPLHQRLLKA